MINDFLNEVEGVKLQSYQDSAGIYTIGVGSTLYKDGSHVGPGQTITLQEAYDLRDWEVKNKSNVIQMLLGKTVLKPQQIEALISFTYNEGIGALTSSTLLKKVKANPNDLSIRDEFMKWNKITVKGKLIVSQGLINRRKKEADLYFS